MAPVSPPETGASRIAEIACAMKEFSQRSGDEKTQVDLNSVLRNTITIARNEWKYVSEVVTDLQPDLPPIDCHEQELKEVFLHLIVNAAEAIEAIQRADSDKGAIGIRTRADGDLLEVRISDTGMGIPKAIHDQIFEPYFTTKEVDKGTGQGLALAHAFVVERHGGSIEFESEFGKGTTFIIRLPQSSDA